MRGNGTPVSGQSCGRCDPSALRAARRPGQGAKKDPHKGRFRAWLFRIARNLLVNFLAGQRRHARGSGSTSVQAMLEAQPAGDAEAEAEFRAEFQRRAFRWAAEQLKCEFTDSTWQA